MWCCRRYFEDGAGNQIVDCLIIQAE